MLVAQRQDISFKATAIAYLGKSSNKRQCTQRDSDYANMEYGDRESSLCNFDLGSCDQSDNAKDKERKGTSVARMSDSSLRQTLYISGRHFGS